VLIAIGTPDELAALERTVAQLGPS
jgi:hypothetical protein